MFAITHASAPWPVMSAPALALRAPSSQTPARATAFVHSLLDPAALSTRTVAPQSRLLHHPMLCRGFRPRQPRRGRHRIHTQATLQGRDSDEGHEAAAMGLDGKWEVESGGDSSAGSRGKPAEGARDQGRPGQLPAAPSEDQDWADWAREWRDDPQGKADRLMKEWEAEGRKVDPAKRTLGSGDNNAATRKSRATKSGPAGITVTEVGADGPEGKDGAEVDWSQGQQLAEADRERDFALEWQREANRLNSLSPDQRKSLEANLRQALGKNKKDKGKKDKKRKKSPAMVAGGSKGFGVAVACSDEGSQRKLRHDLPAKARTDDLERSNRLTHASVNAGEVEGGVASGHVIAKRVQTFGGGSAVMPIAADRSVETQDAVDSGDELAEPDGSKSNLSAGFGRGIALPDGGATTPER